MSYNKKNVPRASEMITMKEAGTTAMKGFMQMANQSPLNRNKERGMIPLEEAVNKEALVKKEMTKQPHWEFVKFADLQFDNHRIEIIAKDYLRKQFAELKKYCHMWKNKDSRYDSLCSTTIKRILRDFWKNSHRWNMEWLTGEAYDAIRFWPSCQMVPLFGGVLYCEEAWSLMYDLFKGGYDIHIPLPDKVDEPYLAEQIELLLAEE